MVKLFQMLQGDAEYFGLLLTKVVIHKVTQMVIKAVFLLQCTMKSPISVYQQWFSQLWNWLQIISNGQIMLCKKILSFFKAMHHVHVLCVHFGG